jgi:hypothetical protein
MLRARFARMSIVRERMTRSIVVLRNLSILRAQSLPSGELAQRPSFIAFP